MSIAFDDAFGAGFFDFVWFLVSGDLNARSDCFSCWIWEKKDWNQI